MSTAEGMLPAVITAAHHETPTVKRFELRPDGPRLLSFKFLPGQWVDLRAPSVEALGGYTITSTPRQLQCCGTFELAVKHSSHPVAAWLHNVARVGDHVAVRVGGSFHFQPGDERRPLLLLAGGIGINPLKSILQHRCELLGYEQQGAPTAAAGSEGSSSAAAAGAAAATAAATPPPRRLPRAALLYSAAAPAELAFRRELEALEHWAGGSLRLHLRSTAPDCKEAGPGGVIHCGRIRRRDLQAALQWLQHDAADLPPAAAAAPAASATGGSSSSCPAGVAALVCGPPAMEDALIADLQSLGLRDDQIRFERWW